MFSYARARMMAGFNLVMEASARRDEHAGVNDGVRPPESDVISPDRLAAAEARKAKAKAEELAKGRAMKLCR